MTAITQEKKSTKTAKKTVTVKKTKTTERTAERKTVETTRVQVHANDVIGTVKKEGEFTFAQTYDKVNEGYVRIVKYEDTTIKVFDKNNLEIAPAKPTICRAIAILDSFDEVQLSAYAKKSTTRSSGARLLKLLGDRLKTQEEV